MATGGVGAAAIGKSAVNSQGIIKEERDLAAEQKEMFLKLMIAQLRNQDPSSPMDQKDMMAGISQMTQVEQMMNMAKSMESLALSQGVGMIGKTVEYSSVLRDADGNIMRNELHTGVVEHIVQKGGIVKLVMADSGVEVFPADVTRVG